MKSTSSVKVVDPETGEPLDIIEVHFTFKFTRSDMGWFGLGPNMAEVIFGMDRPVSSAVMVLKMAKYIKGCQS